MIRAGVGTALGLVLLASSGPVMAAIAPEVSAPAGRLRGVPAPTHPDVDAFLGIPFAAPPVGPLRWREPQPAPRWSGVREAGTFGARCMQQPLFSDMMFRSPGPSEDCLYLNVWRPAGVSAGTKLPVLVYIYGGGFVAGDASERRYDGANMAAHGMVVVTLNYRLGVFGFLSLPELTAESAHHASGNYGLLDQAAALEWVKRNIAAFGGDPRHITIGGESAGSMSVSVLMASPLTRGSIVGAIGESGGVMAPTFHPAALPQAEEQGRAFAGAVGSPTLAALRAMPADALLAAQGQAHDTHFGVVIDGYMLREPPTATFTAGQQAHVPLLVGTNSQENSAESLLGTESPTLAGYQAALAREFGDRAAQVGALYPAASDAEVPAAATVLASDRWLAHSTWKWFDLQRRSGAPVYYYRYARVRPAPLAAGGAPWQPPLGAVHSAEIEYALGNLDANPAYAWTPDDRRVSATMQGYWINFVKTGDPNGPGLPEWPAAARDDAAIQRQLIDVDTHATSFPEQRRYQAIDALLTPR